MNSTTEEILKIVSDWKGSFCGAYSIREDGKGIARMSTEHIHITPKEDKPGLDIVIDDGTKGESLSIPACVTHGDVDDLVYNDFYIGSDCDVTIVAGCGVHTDNGEPARHNGIHRFFIKDRSHVRYLETHVGLGKGSGDKSIDPVTEVFLGEDSVMEMDTSQIGGVTKAKRVTNGTGHSECDAILTGHGRVSASPQLDAACLDAALIHEAAIGKIAGEQLLKLETFGLTEAEAEERIIKGFLK